MTVTKRKPMRQYEIEAVLTRRVTVRVEATDSHHAAELFERGEWDEEFPGGELSDWKAIDKPREIR